MTLELIVLGGLSALELLLYIPPLWHVHRVVVAGLLVTLAWTSGLLFASHIALGSGLVLLISLYRIFNLLRLVEGKMHELYLRHVTLRTSWNLVLLQLIALGAWGITKNIQLTSRASWLILAGVQLAIAICLVIATRHNLRSLQASRVDSHLADRDLPSISVCIPARNETAALENCLHALVNSDYPKLEILVLDDQSHDRTPDIIRSFAHDGVRFIRGDDAPANWLAKNWAYKRLFEEASGEILVFAGVDVQFERGSLRTIITTMLSKRAQMLSLLPANVALNDARHSQSILLQPARYAWELCLPRWLLQRPPVLSTCWLAQRTLLEQAGGFDGVARAITPESHFAKLAVQQQAYLFLQADEPMQIRSSKRFADQWDTALRTRYPQLHRRPELVLLLSLGQLVNLVLPFGMIIGSLVARTRLITALSCLTTILLCWVYATIVDRTYRRFILRGVLALPIAVLLDIYIRHISMWRYEFGHVIWKGRDVSQPVMHVIPHLPKLP